MNHLVRMEKQLTDYKLRFFTNISHEFRTPLTLIRAAAESLSGQKDISESSKKKIDMLNRNTKQMSQLIDQLLEFRKIQQNVLTLNLELTMVNSYFRDIFNAFQELAKQKKIEYSFTALSDDEELYFDRNKVEMIVYNLLSNAFKFTPAYSRVELILERPGDWNFLIMVRDTGIGIPVEKQDLLFSRFMQIHFSSEGTGIGLSLVKEFTEAHKGKVRFSEIPAVVPCLRWNFPWMRRYITINDML
ncbi:MAG: HAMP domain-containing histidine kinase [Bacteroidales bacterium]|nr:HAMP domain-containing histidine kinase [Bacteroidales bacterium]